MNEPPAAGNLPGGQFSREESGEFRDCRFDFCVEGSNDGVRPVVVMDAENDTFEDGGVCAENGFNGFG